MITRFLFNLLCQILIGCGEEDLDVILMEEGLVEELMDLY